MDLTYSDEYDSYAATLRGFLAENWDRSRARDKEFVKSFRVKATSKGYLYRGIPEKYGGSEQPADVIKAQIISDEFSEARAPREVPDIGMMMVVPTLLELGEDWQKDFFIEKTVLGEYKWAQGYSEPGSGSDLASLKTKAELIGNEWVINGHKVWTTGAQTSTHMFCLCRTEPDAPKHSGISYILLDFKQPGVTVRPLKQISGESEFCEVFLEDVRTPANWIVGERGQGWEVSKVNLKHERNSVGGGAGMLVQFEKLKHLAAKRGHLSDPIVQQRILEIEGYVMSHLYAGYYQQTCAAQKRDVGALGRMNKLNSTEIGKMFADLATDLLDDVGLLMPDTSRNEKPGDEKWLAQIMGSLGMSIAGGTSNIQRNLIAERGFALPKQTTG